MASMRARNGKWYARVSISNNGSRIDKQISLKTNSRTLARKRLIIIEKYEKDIKSGLEFSFPWQNGGNGISMKTYQLGEAIDEYLRHRKVMNLRKATLDQNELALTHFKTTLGSKFDIERLNKSHIDRFIHKYSVKHSTTTINMNIRAIKTFVKWLVESGKLKRMVPIKQLQQNPSIPEYLTEVEFKSIMELPNLSDHYKSVFRFYRDTGCRLSEPFRGELDGNWLTISGASSKTHAHREIELSDEQVKTLIAMRKRIGLNPKRHLIHNYSKVFKKSCKEVVLKNRFHHLRHTFAVMEYLRTRDIYMVSKKLGHASVVTTEIYAKFNLKKLAGDFPSLIKGENGKNE